jgi:Mitochondrial biogenesis AIM24
MTALPSTPQTSWRDPFRIDASLVLPAAFLLCSLALAIHLADLMTFHGEQVSTRAIYSYLAPMGAVLLLLVLVRPFRQSGYGCLALAGAFAAASVLSDFVAVPRSLQLSVIAAAIIVMVSYIRVGVEWYAAFVISCGALVGWRLDDPLIGVVGAAFFGVLLFSVNYPVQMILDHSHERSRARALWKSAGFGAVLGWSLLYWLPSGLLFAGGVWLNTKFQEFVVEKAYQSDLVTAMPDQPHNSRSDIERDIYYTISQWEIAGRKKFEESLKERMKKGAVTVATVPDVVTELFEQIRPPRANVNKACSGAVSPKILGKRFTFKGVCAGIVLGIEGWVLGWFERARASAIASTTQRVQQAKDKEVIAEQTLLDAGNAGIKQLFDNVRSIASTTFTILLALSLSSYALLASALIGGFALVFGRLIFHFAPNKENNGRPGPDGMTFRLDRSAALAAPLNFKVVDHVDLRKAGAETASINLWYVAFAAMRIGTGTHMRIAAPQKRALTLRRFFTGRFFMTKVDLASEEVIQASAQHSPRISLPGDLKLVCIELSDAQEVVFHPRDLMAFSDGVGLSSVYTTHVAAKFFGLGSFYAAAKGSGMLILVSEGSQVGNVPVGLSVPPATLLAWDRRADFNLAQQKSFSGIWLNEASLVAASAGTAIVDEGRASSPRMPLRFWRLVRYLLLPF